jgi:hypothetical protein
MDGLIAHRGAELIGRQDLRGLVTPSGTQTHRPVPHADVVGALVEALGMRGLAVTADQYAVTPDHMRMFGVLGISLTTSSVRLCIGLRNSHDKSFSLALTVGYRVFVCDNMAFYGDFQPVMKKHSKNLNIVEVVDSAVSKIQRNFEPLKQRIDVWKDFGMSDDRAKGLIYAAFIEGQLEAPRHLARKVHEHYFEPQHEEFKPRNAWSLSNAFTSAFKELEPIPRFKATAKLAGFLGGLP